MRLFQLIEKSHEDKINKRITNIATMDSERRLVGVTKTKFEDVVGVIILHTDCLIRIELYEHKGKPSTLTAVLNGSTINIGDIQMARDCRGFGSIAMKTLIDYAKEIKVKKITGELSQVDVDHFDRLEYFYGKHGFEVIFNTDRTEGSIELKL